MDTPSAPKPPVDALPGLPDHEVIKELGRGGMGVVYLAANKVMGRHEVLKVVNPQMLAEPGAMDRFLQEIRSAAQLSHPNIVTAHAVLRSGDSLVLAMEHVLGENLHKTVAERGPLPIPNACYYTHQVALGLQHAYEKGMVHRDIKPDNLMLARDGKKHTVKILDFGLAKVTREKEQQAHNLTGDGKMMGTPDYIAPEQILDAAKADTRADIYSLGCTLYYLLTGAPPFQGGSLYEKLQAHMTKAPTSVQEIRKEVPPELAAIVAKMMAKDAADRFQKPADVAQALVPFVKGVKSLSGGEGKTEPGGKSATLGGASGQTEGFTLVPDETPRKTLDMAPKKTIIESAAPILAMPVSKSQPPQPAPKAKNSMKLLLIGGGVSIVVVMLFVFCGAGLYFSGAITNLRARWKQAEQADLDRKQKQQEADRQKRIEQEKAETERQKREQNEKQQAALLERQKKLNQAVDEASKALDANDTATARKKIDAARLLLPSDSRIPGLENRFKFVTDEAEFKKNVSAGDKALTSANLAQAIGFYDTASQIRPNEKISQDTRAAILRLQNAQDQLKNARIALDQKDLSNAGNSLRTVRDALFGTSRKQIDGDNRFKLILTTLTEEAADLHWKLVAGLRASSNDRISAGDGASSKADYDQALKEWDASNQELIKAKDFLEVIKPYPGKPSVDEVADALKTTESDLKTVAAKIQTARGRAYMQIGKDAMNKGNASLQLSKKKSARLWDANDSFAIAVDKFTAAQMCLGNEADADLKAARDARDKVAFLMQPLDLDLKKPKSLDTWSLDKLDWTLLKTGKPRLQSGEFTDAKLSSPAVEFPADFSLIVDVAAVDKDGKPRADHWRFNEDLITLTLVPKDKNQERVSISIGRDPKYNIEKFARIAVGNKSTVLSPNQTGTLAIVITRRQGRATISGAAKDLEIPLNQDLSQCLIQAKAPRNVFIAVYSVSLKSVK